MELSLAERVNLLPENEKKEFLAQLGKEDLATLEYSWPFWRRPKQNLPIGDSRYHIFLVLSGRGWGKTRVGAETVRELVTSGKYSRVALVGPTAADCRDVILEGESGLLNIFPPSQRPKYEPSKRRVTFHNGAVGTILSADEPERFRGPQYDLVWADELAAWRWEESWDLLQFGLRLGKHPIAIVTTTPKSTKLIRDLVKRAKQPNSTVHITTGSTYENRSNLAANFFDQIISKYEGTRLGQQEIYAQVLEDIEGALWKIEQIDATRVKDVPAMKRIVVSIDPAATVKDGSDETGIIVTGLGIDNHGYVLADKSGRYTPHQWAKVAVDAYRFWKADRIIAEANNGGDMIREAIRTVDANVPYKAVVASKGKRTRAEPVSALYEQKKIHHLGMFGELEEQMVTFDPINSTTSPDRMDALVWGVTELMLLTPPKRDWSFLPPV